MTVFCEVRYCHTFTTRHFCETSPSPVLDLAEAAVAQLKLLPAVRFQKMYVTHTRRFWGIIINNMDVIIKHVQYRFLTHISSLTLQVRCVYYLISRLFIQTWQGELLSRMNYKLTIKCRAQCYAVPVALYLEVWPTDTWEHCSTCLYLKQFKSPEKMNKNDSCKILLEKTWCHFGFCFTNEYFIGVWMENSEKAL